MESIQQLPHNNPKIKFSCPKCEKQFQWKSGLSRHVKIFHSNNNNYKCSVCNKCFQKQIGLRIHLRRHKIETCEKHVKTNLNSSSQILYSSDSDCEYELITTVSKILPVSSTIFCDKCNKQFLMLSNLQKHINRYHDNKIISDTEAIKFKNKYYFTIHKKKKLYREINTEGKICEKKLCVSNHMQTHNDIRPFLCSVCGKSFTAKKYLLIHLKTHTEERSFKCQHCGKGFIQKGNLVEHLRLHSGLKPYSCETCGKRFAHRSGLTQHLLVHNPIKRHACKICGKRFRLPAHYREHIRVHSGDKPFTCNVCDKAFANGSSLIVHLRTHSGERPFKCKVCGKGIISNMFKSISDLCDVVSHVVYCPDDATMFITLEPNCNEYWIPSSKVTSGSGWIAQSVKDMDEIFGLVLHNIKILKLCKVWVPQHAQPCVYHCIYCVYMSLDQKKKLKTTYGRFRGKVKWVDEFDLKKLLTQENLRSPELVEFLQMCKGATPNLLHEGMTTATPFPAEFLACGGFVELTDHAIINTNTAGIYEQLIDSAAFSKEVQMSLFKEFIFMCFPALYMCQQVFSRFALELGWNKDEAPFLFRAADISRRYGISFRELVIILAAIEPTTSHGGSPAEIRCRYMFRYFDRDYDSALNYSEFKLLINAIRRSKKQVVDSTSVDQEAETLFKGLGLNPEMHTLSLVEFLRAVGDLKLRGTSQVFRSSIGLQQYIFTIQDRSSNNITMQTVYKPIEMNNKLARSNQLPIKHKALKTEEYSLGTHIVKLQKSGTLITLEQMYNLAGAVSPSSTQHAMFKESSKKLSQEMFAQVSLPNEILTSLRYLIQGNRNIKPPTKGTKTKDSSMYSWGQLDAAHFGKSFILICGQVKDVLKSEDRMVDVQAPTYILGDLHGNFNSLLYFEKILWHLGPGLCPCNILFLGDYVDRGPHSMEVIAYLFSYKIQAPRKLILLRGNHEIRDIQKLFTFHTECMNKFGDKLGIEVWNAVNGAFDAMPVAATIDGKVFCCHGGIPPPWLCPTVAAIHSVPCPLSNPDEQSALAWELMWNDPIRNKQVAEDVLLELQANDGFATNTRRGTGHIFTVEALERFLTTNGYSHIIRAHEVALTGFSLVQKGKLLTVFSSAKYCGGANEAACILADQGKLRVLKVETG
ncbi:hypothetical protein RN001_013916 [Aquatica leii]|uniref:Serine/threonine-protein phosphatase n=1 Tax=Aquatica leii TaxID=1421715 RepID=A0AAN7P3D5_9COLE|nr:hypothetical protein RN001_013916 [Aquatica leii]